MKPERGKVERIKTNGRSDWIRTSDPYTPSVVLYQAEPRSDRLKQAICRDFDEVQPLSVTMTGEFHDRSSRVSRVGSAERLVPASLVWPAWNYTKRKCPRSWWSGGNPG